MASPGYPENTVEVRDAHRFNEASLDQFMKRNVAGYPQTDSKLVVRQFSWGQSNPTFYLRKDSNQYVLRKKPPGKLLPSAHAVDREFRVMTALRSTRVPVPRTYALCQDDSVIGTTFYIMEYVAGRIFKDLRLPGVKREHKFAIYSAMNEVLAELHKLDYKRLGLEDFGPKDNYAERQVTRWTKQYYAAKTDDLVEVEELIKYLKENIPTDEDSKQLSLVHGDYRLDNLIFHPTQNRIIAVLDWELATIGHPTSDIASQCIYYFFPASTMTSLAGEDLVRLGVPNMRDYVRAYARNVHKLGPLANFSFFLALSFFRMASIAQGVYKRSLQGNASQLMAKEFGQLVAPLCQLGLDAAKNKLPGNVVARDEFEEKLAHAALLPFQFSEKFWEIRSKLLAFMDDYVYPNVALFHEQHERLSKERGTRWVNPPILEQLKAKAKEAGLWNLFLTKSPHHNFGPGLTNLEYAPLCEIMGRVIHMAPEVFNCSAPDTGNMETLALYGSPQQHKEWLVPLMNGEIRSAFAMTEPLVASSDATNIECSIERDGDHYIVNGRKWWTSGAMDPRCKLLIVMGKTDPTAPAHKQQSMILVPMDAKGVRVVRHLEVFGYDDAPHGHAEMEFVNVRVPATNMLLGEGRGFEIAQGRLGPGRIHHCMRTIGAAEYALELLIKRSQSRDAFGASLASKGTILADIANSRVEITQARLLTLQAAAMMDSVGNKHAKQLIAMIKVAAPNMALKVIDRAIQAHGGMGVCQDTPLPNLWAGIRTLRIADGPDEVHLGTIGKMELLRARL